MSMGWTAQISDISAQTCTLESYSPLVALWQALAEWDSSVHRWKVAGTDGAQQPVWHLYTRTFKLCLLWRWLCFFCDAWQTRVLFFFLGARAVACWVCYWVCFCPPACFLTCFMPTICNSAAPLFLTSVWFARNRIDKWGVTAAEHFGAKKLVNEVMLWFWDPDSPSPGYQELDFLGL